MLLKRFRKEEKIEKEAKPFIEAMNRIANGEQLHEQELKKILEYSIEVVRKDGGVSFLRNILYATNLFLSEEGKREIAQKIVEVAIERGEKDREERYLFIAMKAGKSLSQDMQVNINIRVMEICINLAKQERNQEWFEYAKIIVNQLPEEIAVQKGIELIDAYIQFGEVGDVSTDILSKLPEDKRVKLVEEFVTKCIKRAKEDKDKIHPLGIGSSINGAEYWLWFAKNLINKLPEPKRTEECIRISKEYIEIRDNIDKDWYKFFKSILPEYVYYLLNKEGKEENLISEFKALDIERSWIATKFIDGWLHKARKRLRGKSEELQKIEELFESFIEKCIEKGSSDSLRVAEDLLNQLPEEDKEKIDEFKKRIAAKYIARDRAEEAEWVIRL
jgi:hypothetical protein